LKRKLNVQDWGFLVNHIFLLNCYSDKVEWSPLCSDLHPSCWRELQGSFTVCHVKVCSESWGILISWQQGRVESEHFLCHWDYLGLWYKDLRKSRT